MATTMKPTTSAHHQDDAGLGERDEPLDELAGVGLEVGRRPGAASPRAGPVSSPTRTMWTASGGKTPASAIGWARPAPRRAPSPRPSTARARTWLASISLTTASAPIMATPLRSRVPRMRVKRATSVLTMTSPDDGQPQEQRDRRASRPARRRQHHPARQHARQPRRGRAATSSAGARRSTSSRISVGSGMVAPRSLKMAAKRGMTKVIRKTTAAAPTPVEQRRVDQRGDQRVAELLRLLEELGQAPQRGLEHAALLARPHHVDVEPREGARVVLGERVGQRAAAAHAAQHVAHDRAQARGRGQLGLDGERAIEGQARLEQGGELLGERDQIAAGDAAAAQAPASARPRSAAPLVLRGDLDREVGVALQALDHRPRVGRLHDPVDGLPPLVGRPVREDGHATCPPG